MQRLVQYHGVIHLLDIGGARGMCLKQQPPRQGRGNQRAKRERGKEKERCEYRRQTMKRAISAQIYRRLKPAGRSDNVS